MDDFFRVRLACVVLDACGVCFGKGSLRRKLDEYLVVLQLYALCKSEMPMDIDFMLDDLLDSLRPDGRPKGVKDGQHVPRLRTFNEAAAAVDELLSSNTQTSALEDDESDGEGERVQEVEEEIEDAAPPPAPESSSSESEASDDEEEEDVVVIREEQKVDEFDELAQSEFDREFSRMLADTTVERKAAPPVFDQAVPMFRKKAGAGAAAQPKDDRMQFMLLSKKGNKPQVRNVDIPLDSSIASNVRSHQAAIRAEQEQLKRLVLQNERRLENEDQVNSINSMRRRGINVRVTNS